MLCSRARIKIRYIDQTQGLMEDDESGPGPGDLDVYEKAICFLSGNVEPEPASELDDEVLLAYLQTPVLVTMESEHVATTTTTTTTTTIPP